MNELTISLISLEDARLIIESQKREMSNLSISGMSLRDYFAAQAMQGLLTNDSQKWDVHQRANQAEQAYRIADAMLSEKRQTETKK